MIDAFKRMLRLDGKRSLDAASVGRRLQSAGRIANLNTDLFHGAATIRQRAAHRGDNYLQYELFQHILPDHSKLRRGRVPSMGCCWRGISIRSS